MTVKEILQNNEMIADFMGINHFYTGFSELVLMTDNNTDDIDNMEPILYDTSWDWLMSVLLKIKCLDCGERTELEDKAIFHWEKICRALPTLNIETVWTEAVITIKWWNSVNKQVA